MLEIGALFAFAGRQLVGHEGNGRPGVRERIGAALAALKA